MTLSNVYGFGNDGADPVVVTIHYEGQDGTPYQDPFHLDPDVLMKEIQAGPAENTVPEKRVSKALEAIARALDRRS